jgi:hypothetical protein
MFPKVGLLEEMKGGWKEEKNDSVNNNEIHHICVGTRHTETLLKTINQHRMGEQGEEVQWRGHIDLSTVHVQCNAKAKTPLHTEETFKKWKTRMKNKSH